MREYSASWWRCVWKNFTFYKLPSFSNMSELNYSLVTNFQLNTKIVTNFYHGGFGKFLLLWLSITSHSEKIQLHGKMMSIVHLISHCAYLIKVIVFEKLHTVKSFILHSCYVIFWLFQLSGRYEKLQWLIQISQSLW